MVYVIPTVIPTVIPIYNFIILVRLLHTKKEYKILPSFL